MILWNLIWILGFYLQFLLSKVREPKSTLRNWYSPPDPVKLKDNWNSYLTQQYANYVRHRISLPTTPFRSNLNCNIYIRHSVTNFWKKKFLKFISQFKNPQQHVTRYLWLEQNFFNLPYSVNYHCGVDFAIVVIETCH